MTKTFRVRVVGWALAAFVCLCVGGLIVLGSFLPGVDTEPERKPAGETPAREPARPRSDTESRGDLLADFPGRLDLYAECLERLTRIIPPARY